MKKNTARRSLKSNFIYNFITNVLTLIVPLVTTPYLSRVLHEAGNGRYSFSASIISYFILFASLGFDMYGQRQIAACGDDTEEKSRVFWELFIWKSALTGISLAVLYSVIFTVGFGESYNLLILILSLQLAATPFDIQYFFRGEENFKSIALRSISMRVIGLVCIFVFVKTENDTWIYTLCFAASVFVSYIIMWPSVFRKIHFVKVNKLKLLRHLKPCLLIFLPTLAVTVYSVFDKTMIGLLAKNPDYENGCYEQAYKINGASFMAVTIISSVMMSRNAHDFRAGDVESLKTHLKFAINYVWMSGLPLIAGFAVLAGNLSSWFLGEGYSEVPVLLQIMSVRFIVSGMTEVFGNQLFIAIGKEKYSTIATVCAALVNLVLNYVLISNYGALGAAIATSVCEALVAVILAGFALKQKFITFGGIFKCSWRYIIAAAVMFGATYFIQKFLPYSVWTFLLITAAGVLIYGLALLLLRDKFFLSALKSALNFRKRKITDEEVPLPEETQESNSDKEIEN